MKAKYNKLCSFDMDIAEKLNEEPSRKANLVVNEAIKAHYEGRIIPANCKAQTLDVTDWIIEQIKQSVQVTKLDYSLKMSSFTIMKKDGIIDKVIFYLKTNEIEVDIKFNVIVENEIEIQFIRWVYEFNANLVILDFDNDRLNEIEHQVIFKL